MGYLCSAISESTLAPAARHPIGCMSPLRCMPASVHVCPISVFATRTTWEIAWRPAFFSSVRAFVMHVDIFPCTGVGVFRVSGPFGSSEVRSAACSLCDSSVACLFNLLAPLLGPTALSTLPRRPHLSRTQTSRTPSVTPSYPLRSRAQALDALPPQPYSITQTPCSAPAEKGLGRHQRRGLSTRSRRATLPFFFRCLPFSNPYSPR